MDAQNTLISNAAHQLRNPIAGVLAMAEAVHSAPTPEDAKARSAGLLSAARRASDLANKLLTLERVRAASQETFSASVEVAPLIDEVVEVYQSEVSERGVRIVAIVDFTPIEVIADRLMLGEALSNLIDNALQHGGPTLEQITVTLNQDGDTAVITVEDDGMGLAASEVSTVLARFGQATPGEGSGLGLSIAEAVAQRHGGTLKLETERRGLLVRLILPLAPKGQRPTA